MHLNMTPFVRTSMNGCMNSGHNEAGWIRILLVLTPFVRINQSSIGCRTERGKDCAISCDEYRILGTDG